MLYVECPMSIGTDLVRRTAIESGYMAKSNQPATLQTYGAAKWIISLLQSLGYVWIDIVTEKEKEGNM